MKPYISLRFTLIFVLCDENKRAIEREERAACPDEGKPATKAPVPKTTSRASPPAVTFTANANGYIPVDL